MSDKISQYRIRLTDMRLEINRIIDKELALLDENELRGEKEKNGSSRTMPMIDDNPTMYHPNEDEPIPMEIITKGKPEKD